MSKRALSSLPFLPSLSLGLLTALLVLLWVAGGASRADVIGQVVTRAGVWAIAIAFILFAAPPRMRPVAPVGIFVLAGVLLVALQLIPLPPSLWVQLPGRELLAQAATVSGQEQPWRPISISPGATANALWSLVVPVVTLLLMAGLSQVEHWRVAGLLLGFVVASCLIGLLQFSGMRFDHPMLNDTPGAVSASFANRNHFGLFAAIGCLLAPVWAFQEGGRGRWKTIVAPALVLLFGLVILATGSRMGLLVGALGVGLGLLIVRRRIVSELKRLPKWLSIALVVGTVAVVAAAIILSVTLDRAISLNRALSLGAGEDLRRQALPTVLQMVRTYFPFGSGFGAFDPVYRISEPAELLSTVYFNHAHNDLLEIVLDGGLPGLLLLSAAIIWWLWKSFGALRIKDGSQRLLPRLGSGILLLVLVASLTDYPARTPMIMSIVVIAAVWLNGLPQRNEPSGATAQPRAERGRRERSAIVEAP